MHGGFDSSITSQLDRIAEGRIRDREKIKVLFRMLYDLLYIYCNVDWREQEVLDMIIDRVEDDNFPGDTTGMNELDVMVMVVADVYKKLKDRW